MKSSDRFDFEIQMDPQTSSLGDREGFPVGPARRLRAPTSR